MRRVGLHRGTSCGLRPTSPIVANRRQGSIPMSQTCDWCEQVSPKSVTLAHWDWTFAVLFVRAGLSASGRFLDFSVEKRHPCLWTRGCQNPCCFWWLSAGVVTCRYLGQFPKWASTAFSHFGVRTFCVMDLKNHFSPLLYIIGSGVTCFYLRL
jgi:hypothetical protein